MTTTATFFIKANTRTEFNKFDRMISEHKNLSGINIKRNPFTKKHVVAVPYNENATGGKHLALVDLISGLLDDGKINGYEK